MEEKLTTQQMKSLHFWFAMVAQTLEDGGLSMNEMINLPIRPTKESVKILLWKPIMEATFQKTSTTQLNKQKEIDTIVATLTQGLAEQGIELPNFPSLEEAIYNNEFNLTPKGE